MTTNLQNAIIAGSVLGSLFAEYDPKGTKKSMKIIRANLKKMMYVRARSNPKEFKEAIDLSDKIWRKTVNHFADKKEPLAIEALSSIMRFYNLYSAPLQRFSSVSDKKIERLMIGANCDYEHENNSYMVIDYITDELSEFTGIKRENKLKTKFAILKQNSILEGAA